MVGEEAGVPAAAAGLGYGLTAEAAAAERTQRVAVFVDVEVRETTALRRINNHTYATNSLEFTAHGWVLKCRNAAANSDDVYVCHVV